MQDWMRRPLLHDDFWEASPNVTLPPIHIIVKNGCVPLEAVVKRERELGSTITTVPAGLFLETISSEQRPRQLDAVA